MRVANPARKRWGGRRDKPAPEVARASYTPPTFGAESLFREFTTKGLLVQNANFWGRPDF